MVSSTKFARLSEKTGLSNVKLFQGGASRSLNMNGERSSEGDETLFSPGFSAEDMLEANIALYQDVYFPFKCADKVYSFRHGLPLPRLAVVSSG